MLILTFTLSSRSYQVICVFFALNHYADYVTSKHRILFLVVSTCTCIYNRYFVPILQVEELNAQTNSDAHPSSVENIFNREGDVEITHEPILRKQLKRPDEP